MGGADQWGNITAGLELIRRIEGQRTASDRAHGLSYPLLLDASGPKFGKTAAGTVDLARSGQRPSPYAFYQFWLDRDDAETGRLLRMFTLLDQAEIEAIEAEAIAHPEARSASGPWPPT